MAKLIFTADDYGIIDAIDRGVREAVKAGWINSVEVFPNDRVRVKESVRKLGEIRLDQYAAAQGISEAEAFINVGAHLTITSGTPLLSSTKHFMRKKGRKKGMFRKWTDFERPGPAQLETELQQLREELEEQIIVLKKEVEKFPDTLRFNHLSCHHNSLYYFTEYASVFYDLAIKYQLAVRTPIGRPQKKDSRFYWQLNVRLLGNLTGSERRALKEFSKDRKSFLHSQQESNKLPKMTTYHNNTHYGPIPLIALKPIEKMRRNANRKQARMKEFLAKYKEHESVEFVFHLITFDFSNLDRFMKQAKFRKSRYPGIKGTYFDGRMAEFLSLSQLMKSDDSIAKRFINWSDLPDLNLAEIDDTVVAGVIDEDAQLETATDQRKQQLVMLQNQYAQAKDQYLAIQAQVAPLEAELSQLNNTGNKDQQAIDQKQKEISDLEKTQEPLEWALEELVGKMERVRHALTEERYGQN